MVDSNQEFWPERLAHVLSEIAQHCPDKWEHPCLQWLKYETVSYDYASTPPDREQLSEIIQKLKALQDDDIHTRIDDIENELKLDINTEPALLSWQQIAEMTQSGLIEAGSHTCHHIRLDDSQSEKTLKQEIIQSKSQLEEQLDKPVAAFCYPNGDHSPRAVELVKQYYQCAVTTNKDWNSIYTNEHLLNRIGLHEDISADKTAFLARLSGWI
jgi:peptidoglycan/xylan/chitin deacetylase (PgdA/CDA1 family)